MFREKRQGPVPGPTRRVGGARTGSAFLLPAVWMLAFGLGAGLRPAHAQNTGVDLRTPNASSVETTRLWIETDVNTAIMRLLNSNVAINTTSPGAKLDLWADASQIALNVRLNATPGSPFRIQNSGGSTLFEIGTGGAVTTGTWQGTAVGAAYGGTGQTSYTVGDLLYASGATALSKLAAVATGNALIAQGAGAAPVWGKIGASHVTADDLDFTELKDALTLDASTSVALAGFDLTFTGSGNVGIGTASPPAKLAVGSLSQFRVSSLGNLAQVAGVAYTWPAAQGGVNTFLSNSGAGVLTWGTSPGGYATVQEEGSALTQRATLNFIGAALTAADNAGSARTDVTLSQSPSSSVSVVGTGRLVSTGTGLTGGGDLTADRTLAFDYSATLAGNPALAASQATFASTGLIFEGSGADTNEGLLTAANPTADRTWTLPDASGTAAVSASGYIALSAAGNVTFSGTLAVGSGGTGSTSFSTGSVVFSNGTVLTQDNANFFWNNGSDFLGLSTASPRGRLDLATSAAEADIYGIDRLVGYNDIRFYPNNTVAGNAPVAITSGGALLIGATSATEDLTIRDNNTGAGTAAGFTLIDQYSADPDATFSFTMNGDLFTGGSDPHGSALMIGTYKQFMWRRYDGAYRMAVDVSDPDGSGGLLIGNFSLGTTPYQRLDVRGGGYFSGNVGIGSTTPRVAVDLVGQIRIGSGLAAPPTTSDLHVTTTKAQLVLDDSASAGSAYARFSQFANGAAYLSANLRYDGADWLRDDTSVAASVLATSGTTPLIVQYAASGANPATLSEALRVDSSGNVAVGTTAANNRLEVYGTAANTSGLRFTRLTSAYAPPSSATKYLSVDANGDVILVNDGSSGAGYATIQEEAVSLTQRATINFIGAALTAADNGGSSRTDVTLSQSPASASVVGTGRLVSTGTGLTGGGDLSADRTLSFDYSATLAGNPGLSASLATFASTGLIFEGSGADTNEGLLTAANPTADRTWTLPDASGTVAVSASGNIALSAAGALTFTGTLGVASGGTGAGTFTANGVLYGNTTGAVGVTAAGTTGQVLIGNTSAAPSWSAAPTLTGLTLTGGASALKVGTSTAQATNAPIAMIADTTSDAVGLDSNIELLVKRNGYAGLGIVSSTTTASFIHLGDLAAANMYAIEYWNTDDTFRIGGNGILAIGIPRSSGNVGINTLSPARRFQVGSSVSTADEGARVTSQADAYLELIGDTDNVTEDHNSYIYWEQDGAGIQAVAGFVGTAGTEPRGGSTYTGSLANHFLLGHMSASGLQLGTNDNARLTIDSNGDVGVGVTAVGTTNNASRLEVVKAGGATDWYRLARFLDSDQNTTKRSQILVGRSDGQGGGNGRGNAGQFGFYYAADGSNSNYAYMSVGWNAGPGDGAVRIYGDGHMQIDHDTPTKPSAGGFSATSDIRLKKNVRTLEGALDRLLQLRGVTFEWKEPDGVMRRPGIHTGFVAQEVEKVFPDWVAEMHDGYKVVGSKGFDALTVEALRELKQKNDALKVRVAELDKLKDEVAALRAALAADEARPAAGGR